MEMEYGKHEQIEEADNRSTGKLMQHLLLVAVITLIRGQKRWTYVIEA